MEFWIFGVLSFLSLITVICWTIFAYPKCKERPVSPLKLITAGVFVAVMLLYLPIYYRWDGWKAEYAVIRPALLTLMRTIQVFVMGAEVELVERTLSAEPAWLKTVLCLYAMVLHVVAPMLTFSNVLLQFQNFTGELRIRFCCKRDIFVMSELNPQSITMAESILSAKEKTGEKKPLIVFCNVFTQNEEDRYELLLQARELSAVCLKKDIAHLQFGKNGQRLEIFLMGENETENTTQLVRLTNALRKTDREISLNIFSSDPTTEYVLDALHLGDDLLSNNFLDWLETHADKMLRQGKWEEKDCSMFGNFSVHHFDPIQNLVMDVLTKYDYADYKEIQKVVEKNKTISITTLGLGRHGTQFLKTAAWFYQRSGITVEFNIFDLGQENGDPYRRLCQECPELINHPAPNVPGEASYDIKVYTGIDCFGDGLDRTILETDSDRFDKTNLVFIALGDDDRNIRGAMTAEMVFARKQFLSRDFRQPYIYAVVYDDEKAANLNLRGTPPCGSGEKTIRFVGTRQDQYSYALVEKNKQHEEKALTYHLDWLIQERQVRNAYNTVTQPGQESRYASVRELLDREQKGPVHWADEEFYDLNPDGSVNFDGHVNTGKVRESMRYVCDSYYRKSSLSRAIHQEALQKLDLPSEPCKTGDGRLCVCEACNKKRITEHMRWNAYMRSQGYRRIEKYKDHTAKLHRSLVPWEELPWKDRFKD